MGTVIVPPEIKLIVCLFRKPFSNFKRNGEIDAFVVTEIHIPETFRKRRPISNSFIAIQIIPGSLCRLVAVPVIIHLVVPETYPAGQSESAVRVWANAAKNLPYFQHHKMAPLKYLHVL